MKLEATSYEKLLNPTEDRNSQETVGLAQKIRSALDIHKELDFIYN